MKIVLSHTYKSVTSDVILKNLFIFSLFTSSPGGPGMVNG